MARRVICVMGRVLDQEDGLGVYSTNLLRELVRMDTKSQYVILFRTPQNASLFSQFHNTATEVIPARRKIIWDQLKVPLAARRFKANIIFNPKFSLPLLSRCSGVFVLHGSDWYVNPQNYEWWDNFYIRVMLPIYCKKASGLLAISDCIKKDLVKFAGVKPQKVTVSYAAPSPHFTPNPDPTGLRNFINQYRLPKQFMFSVARAYHTGHGGLPYYPGGNLEGLIRGYQIYRSKGGQLPLVIAGKDIEKYLRVVGFKNSELEGIFLTGFIPHEEIVFGYNLAEFFVLTTLYESFALPLVEAMASGCPAIVPTTGACPEVAGGAARLIDPLDYGDIASAMLELDASPELRDKMRKAGLDRAKTFTWNRTAQLTLDVFDAIRPVD